MCKLIAFTGIEYSGRTTVILNTATELSEKGKRNVLVVDADQTRGRLATALNLASNKYGLQEAVTSLDKTVFDNCFIYDSNGLTYLTLPGKAISNQLLNLKIEQATDFYNKVSRNYDYILVDCGNILYEAMSAVAVFDADIIVFVLPPEKRGLCWFKSYNPLFMKEMQNKTFVNVISNIKQQAELPVEQIYNCNNFVEIPFISTMRDFTSRGDIYLDKSIEKRGQRYRMAIGDFANMLKEQNNEYK